MSVQTIGLSQDRWTPDSVVACHTAWIHTSAESLERLFVLALQDCQMQAVKPEPDISNVLTP